MARDRLLIFLLLAMNLYLASGLAMFLWMFFGGQYGWIGAILTPFAGGYAVYRIGLWLAPD
jgi:xanthine/uracil permease